MAGLLRFSGEYEPQTYKSYKALLPSKRGRPQGEVRILKALINIDGTKHLEQR
jgi:hypothetical protein